MLFAPPPRFMRRILALIFGLLFATTGRMVWAAEQPAKPAAPGGKPAAPAARPVDFGREVRPLLARRCYKCHGPDKSEGGLRLNSAAAAMARLDSGDRAIVPRNVAESTLLSRITSTDESERMPLKGKPLAAGEIKLLRRWIIEGARWEGHWAFQPLAHPSPPTVEKSQWVRTPVDAFVLRRLETGGLAPSPPASRTELARRVYYDVTGLPPTPAEVDAFAEDRTPRAYARLVDRLLASPRYGEQWGRFWLDVVRYADTNSFERDAAKPFAWRYRDYVIRSFNDDKPYDQFVREQLAGDELPRVTADSIIATGYYRLGLWDDEPGDRLLARFDELDDIVTTTGQAFLGLTVNCARCHDHKIDPIPQRDYYRLLAFFNGINSMAKEGPTIETPLPPTPPGASAGATERSIGTVPLAPLATNVWPAAGGAAKHEGYKADPAAQSDASNAASSRPLALSVTERGPDPPKMFVMRRGNPRLPGEEVEPGFPSVLDPPPAVIPPPRPGARTCGRRRVLAEWIASPENRLTARVIVNRIWQHHFGRGIVRSPNNFGLLGDPPSHPELLDFLATELVRNGWHIKPLHRMILLSSTYRMSSRANPAGLAKDPDNNLFWRFNMRRLSAEEIRDSMLAVTGQLNLAMYGPGYFPKISQEVMAGQSVPGMGWGTSTAAERRRRSIYIHVKRSLITPLLASFDFPETDGTCEARFSTTQPAQALAMLNGDFVNEQAAAFAARLRREAGDDPAAQVRLALRLALGRSPDAAGVARGLKLIESLRREHGATPEAALNYFCLMALNLNEFVYLD